jgi:hypothetical protein
MPRHRHSNSILMGKIDSALRAASTRVRFTVQSGQPWTLTEKDVFSRFSSFGKINTVSFVGYYKSCGIITFSSASDAERNLNKVVDVKGCLLHTTTDFYDLSPFPAAHQILIKSESFPRSWERAVIIKDFFQIFGEVTGVNILAANRVIVNFREDLAARMTGSLVQVRGRVAGGAGALTRL